VWGMSNLYSRRNCINFNPHRIVGNDRGKPGAFRSCGLAGDNQHTSLEKHPKIIDKVG
jgi:hypothetical protein